MFPIHAHGGGLEAGDSKVHAVAGSGESSGEVKLDVGRGVRSGEVGAEDFESDFRLAQRGSQRRLRRAWRNRHGIAGEVEIVGAANVAEGIHQNNAMKARAVFRSAFNFGLILFVDFGADERGGFFQLLYTFFERGWSRGRSGCARSCSRFIFCRGRLSRRRLDSGGRCWTFQQRARGLQVVAQLVHLGAGLGIFGAHFFHQAAQLSDLILQITNRAGSFTGRGRRRGRFLGAAQCTEAPCAA